MITQTLSPAPIAPKAAPTLAPTSKRVERPVARPSASAAPQTTDDRVELVRIGDDTWRVCDRTAVPGERGYIVGYLQAVDSEFEMLWMHPRPGIAHRHPGFDEALRAISTRMRMFPR